MSVILYNIFLFLYRAAIHTSSLFNTKAKKWVRGRKDIFRKLEAAIPADQKVIWMHCASLGEFEQGRPVLERLRAQNTNHKILLTFFSPSGYEAQKNYKGADWIFYLPLDGAVNARRFLGIVHPSLVIFVKYEFWYYYLKKIKYRDIPLLLISAQFRADMSFFKWYGGIQRKILSRFDHLFVQNAASKELMDGIGLSDITTVSGDTRFDRVIEIAETASPLPLIDQFLDGQKVLIAGSTWKEDEAVLKPVQEYLQVNRIKLIIAPHEVDKKNIDSIQQQFEGSLLYSSLPAGPGSKARVLIIDNIGMLSKIYRYAWCSVVGGGFSKTGVHNVLEAAVYNKPVLHGPNYEFYLEARGLIAAGGAFVIKNKDQLIEMLDRFLSNESLYTETCKRSGEYVRANGGAVREILRYIQEKRLLTN